MYVVNDTEYPVHGFYYIDTAVEPLDSFGEISLGPVETFKIRDVIFTDNVFFTIITRDQFGRVFNCTYKYNVDKYKPTLLISTIYRNCGGGNLGTRF